MPNKGFKVADKPFKLDDSPVGSTACPGAGRSNGWQLGRMNDIVGSATHRVYKKLKLPRTALFGLTATRGQQS